MGHPHWYIYSTLFSNDLLNGGLLDPDRHVPKWTKYKLYCRGLLNSILGSAGWCAQLGAIINWREHILCTFQWEFLQYLRVCSHSNRWWTNAARDRLRAGDKAVAAHCRRREWVMLWSALPANNSSTNMPNLKEGNLHRSKSMAITRLPRVVVMNKSGELIITLSCSGGRRPGRRPVEDQWQCYRLLGQTTNVCCPCCATQYLIYWHVYRLCTAYNLKT